MKNQQLDFSILDEFSSLLTTLSNSNNPICLTSEHLKKFQTLKLQLEKISINKEKLYLELNDLNSLYFF